MDKKKLAEYIQCRKDEMKYLQKRLIENPEVLKRNPDLNFRLQGAFAELNLLESLFLK